MLLAGVRMFGSAPRRSRPQRSDPRISVFEFRISKLKIQFLNLEFQVPCPDMRVSVCAYPGAGAGEGVPAALRAPVLTGGFSVWLALAYGVCSVAFAVWPQAHSGEASALAQWPIRPGAVRTGRERERKRAQTVWRGGFRRGRVRPTPIPPGRLLTSDCRGSASPRGDSALAATSAGSSGQSAWAWSAAADSAFRAPLAPVWPKAIARQAPMGLGSALWPLGFGTWPWRCRLCPFLLSSPLHLAQARLGAQAPRCPGVQVSRRSGRHGRARSLGIRTSPRLPRPAGFAPPVPVRIRFGPLASGYCASGSRAARMRPIPVWPLALQAAYMGAP